MIEDKQKLIVLLYDTLNDLKVEGEKDTLVELNSLVTSKQKYDIVMAIMSTLPMNGHEMVKDFHDKFKIPKEVTHIVPEFTSSKLRFTLLLEEVLELGQALGFNNSKLYNLFTITYKKVIEEPQEANLTNVLDALTDILFIAYGAIDVFNLGNIQHEAMKEVYTSNMSKLIPVTGGELAVIKKSRTKLQSEGLNTVTNDLKNGYISITNQETDKILKPVTYFKPNLKQLINKYLKSK